MARLGLGRGQLRCSSANPFAAQHLLTAVYRPLRRRVTGPPALALAAGSGAEDDSDHLRGWQHGRMVTADIIARLRGLLEAIDTGKTNCSVSYRNRLQDAALALEVMAEGARWCRVALGAGTASPG